MKKLFSIMLALTLALSLSATAFAEESTRIQPGSDGSPTPPSASADVTLNVAPAYLITIPGDVTLMEDEETGTYKQDAKVIAEAGVRLLEGQTIQVSLSAGGEDGFVLITDEGTTLDYTVKVGDSDTAIASGDTVATFDTSTDKQSVTLHFEAENPTYAGDYSDTVTFTISATTGE